MNKLKTTLTVTSILTLVCFIVFKDYLTLERAYYFYDICADGFYYSYPQFCGFADYIARYHFPSWSFKMGMGQNIFPFLLRDPFDIVFYIAGSKKVLYLTAYIEAIKVIFTGLLFFRYLRVLNFSIYASFIGSVLFAFCGFIIEGSAWFVFSFEGFNFALLLLGFELFFIKRKWILFVFGIALLALSMPFNLYLYGLFLLIYAIFRLAQTGKFNIVETWKLFSSLLLLTILGILIVAPFFVQNILLLLNSPRGAGLYGSQFSNIPVFQLSDKTQIGTAILRSFSTDILGSGSNYKGWDTVLGGPLFYCGLLCLLLLPQVFTFLDKKSRILFIIFVVLWVMPVIFPFFRRAIWLFSGDYYRGYSLFVTFVILFYAIHAFEFIIQKRKINIWLLCITLFILLALLYFPLFIDNEIIDKSIRKFVTIILFLYSLILALINKYTFSSPFTAVGTDANGSKNEMKGNMTIDISFSKHNMLKYLLVTIIICEIGYAGNITTHRRDFFGMFWLRDEKVMYNNYFNDAAQYLKKIDHSFYRIDKNFDPPSARYTDLNTSQYQGYNSTASYNSFNQLYYIKFLQLMGIADKNNEGDSRWAIGLLENPVLESQHNVKYFMSQNNYHPIWMQMWDSIAHMGNVTIYKNNLVLPFGFTQRYFIKESAYNTASPQQKKFITASSFVINDKDVSKVSGLKEYHIGDTIKGELGFDTFRSIITQTPKDSLSLTYFDDTKLSGTISLQETRLLYMAIPIDAGWHLFVDGKEQEKLIVNGGMTGVMLPPGTHKIKMLYLLPYMKFSIALSSIGIVVLFVSIWLSKRSKIRA
ncbi:MAG: hypothetical protein K0Q79_1287 [Flavipsychrobacter sp.]|jgi:hypothetical protein|nr:hypothetical protein [Flavipsychrobacter sp.]